LYLAEKRLVRDLTWKGEGRGLVARSPLAIGSTTIEGLELMVRATTPLPDRDVRFMLRLSKSPSDIHLLERVCWRPKKPHNNKGLGPEEYRYVVQEGSHVHDMFLNWDEETDKMNEANLPVAVPALIDGFSVEAAFEFALARFNIDPEGFNFEPPPWERGLFDE